MAWLKTPQCLIDACSDQIPKLEAEEALTEVVTLGVGTGVMEKKVAARMMRQWSTTAAGPNPAPKKPRFNLPGLAAAGIGVPKVRKS